MPQIDLPLEELRNYNGTNPKPDDFDRYWDAALAELAGVKPHLKQQRASFQSPYADCYDWYFTGTRGARLHAKCLFPRRAAGGDRGVGHPGSTGQPDAGGGQLDTGGDRGVVHPDAGAFPPAPMPAVIKYHGYSGNSGDWFGLLPYAAAGFVVCAMDVRGQGGESSDPGGATGNTLKGHIIRGLDDEPEMLMFRHVFLDTVQLVRLVMELPQVDPERVGVFGGSQGGALSLACAALEPRVNRVASMYPFLADYKRVWDLDIGGRPYEELRDYFRRFDPRHERETDIFTRLGYIDVQHLADRIRGRLLMFTGLMDEVCPPSTQFAAYNKISAPKEMVIYPDYGHEQLPDAQDRIFGFMMDLA